MTEHDSKQLRIKGLTQRPNSGILVMVWLG